MFLTFYISSTVSCSSLSSATIFAGSREQCEVLENIENISDIKISKEITSPSDVNLRHQQAAMHFSPPVTQFFRKYLLNKQSYQYDFLAQLF